MIDKKNNNLKRVITAEQFFAQSITSRFYLHFKRLV